MTISTFDQLQAARREYETLCQSGQDYQRASTLLKAIQRAERDNREWR